MLLRPTIKLMMTVLILITASCFPVNNDVQPFMTQAYVSVKGDAPIVSGDEFWFTLAVETVQPMRNVIIKVTLPNELSVRKLYLTTLGDKPYRIMSESVSMPDTTKKEFYWSGEVVPDRKVEFYFNKYFAKKRQQLELVLASEADSKKWRSPLRGTIEFDYDPKPEMRVEGYVDIEPGHYKRDFFASYATIKPRSEKANKASPTKGTETRQISVPQN